MYQCTSTYLFSDFTRLYCANYVSKWLFCAYYSCNMYNHRNTMYLCFFLHLKSLFSYLHLHPKSLPCLSCFRDIYQYFIFTDIQLLLAHVKLPQKTVFLCHPVSFMITTFISQFQEIFCTVVQKFLCFV